MEMEFKAIDLNRRSNAAQDKNRDIYRETCKASLKNEVETNFKTTFIGSVDIIDKRIGYLWGHGKAFTDLTEVEKEWREVRNHIRNLILDNGNNQLRAAHEKIDNYVVEIKPNSVPVTMEPNR